MSRIENHKFTIDDAFRTCFYIVPDYQREYVWRKEEVNQLLEDINEQMDASSSEYFIGIVLVSLSDNKTKRHSDVIDGQQRLTTIFLILCALRVFFRGMEQGEVIDDLMATRYTNPQGGIETNLKLEPHYENAYEVMQMIVKTNDAPKKVRANIKNAGIPISGSVKKIIEAYEQIYNYLKDNYDDKDKLKEYWGHLANNVVFIQISTDVSSALKIFETINERGVGLNSMDLLKNLLFTQIKPEEFSKLKGKWEEITKELEENKEKPLRFLRYFLMANYKINTKDAIIREDEIYTWFSNSKNATLTEYQSKPFEFVRKIKRNVNCYTDLSKGFGNNKKSNLAMDSLQQLVGTPYRLHYILLLAAVPLPEQLFDHFVSQLESFLFYYIFTKTPSKELEKKFALWADEVREIAHIENQDEQRTALDDFIAKRFKENMNNKSQELNDALKRLTLGTMQKYRTRYLLERLTQHVDMEFRGQKIRDSLKAYSKLELEIEHILPNTPDHDLLTSWKKAHPGDENLEQGYNEYKNRLGNLTLLERPLNISAGNDFFSKKKPKYADSGNYLTRSLSGFSESTENSSITRINEDLCAPDDWDAKAIDDRQEKLIKLAFDVWKITEIK